MSECQLDAERLGSNSFVRATARLLFAEVSIFRERRQGGGSLDHARYSHMQVFLWKVRD